MKNRLKSKRRKQVFACCICKRSINPKVEPCCTLPIDRGVPGYKQRPTFKQEIWTHGVCLKLLIPITEYSFPELDTPHRKYKN